MTERQRAALIWAGGALASTSTAQWKVAGSIPALPSTVAVVRCVTAPWKINKLRPVKAAPEPAGEERRGGRQCNSGWADMARQEARSPFALLCRGAEEQKAVQIGLAPIKKMCPVWRRGTHRDGNRMANDCESMATLSQPYRNFITTLSQPRHEEH